MLFIVIHSYCHFCDSAQAAKFGSNNITKRRRRRQICRRSIGNGNREWLYKCDLEFSFTTHALVAKLVKWLVNRTMLGQRDKVRVFPGELFLVVGEVKTRMCFDT